jgi:protein-L-isoaspartate(D-aspartate) O-methyltransferase
MASSHQRRLVEKLFEERVIYTQSVYQCLISVDRGYFFDGSLSSYEDSPKNIGYNATISAPHMHGFALEYLKDHLIPGTNVLDVGSGSGYLTLCMAEMMGYQGSVIGIEHIRELVEKSIRNIQRCKPGILASSSIHMIEGDGRNGYPPFAPYKVIHVGAAAEEIPESLISQLDLGGRMMIPVGKLGRSQKIMIVDKDTQGNINIKNELSVSYIPLTDKERQYR